MKVFLEATVQKVTKKEFTNRDTNDVEVKYSTLLRDEEGAVIAVNAKKDFSEFIEKEGVASLGVFAITDGHAGFYLTLIDFVGKHID